MKFSILLFLAILPFPIVAQSLPQNDTQSWNDITISKPIFKAKDKKGKEFDKVTLFFTGTLRVTNKIKILTDARVGFGFDIKINHFLTLTPSYVYRSFKPNLNTREYESRLRFAATLEKKWKKFSIKDRNLFEYRLRNSHTDSTRYRNKLTVSYPILKNDKELFAPFVADEIYYDFSAKRWSRNEVSAGITRKITPHFSVDFYYLRQDNRSGTPKSANVFGINLKIKLD